MARHHELTFASNEEALDVRTFTITESLNGLFQIDLVARSQSAELDLDTIVGHGAAFRFMGDAKIFATPRLKSWAGVCAHMEAISQEANGFTTYLVRIVPPLFRTSLRVNCRIFQRKTLPDIVLDVLKEWEIEPDSRLTEVYIKHEYRLQYMETDFAFISRTLEEAGITYFYEFQPGDEETPPKTKLVLSDAPGKAPPREAPIDYVDIETLEGTKEHIASVKLTTEIRPGHAATTDWDFRKPDYKLLQEHKDGIGKETMLEHYQHLPGSFWVESEGSPLPVADGRGLYKSNDTQGKTLARYHLEGERTDRRVVRFESNAVDLAPGVVFTMMRHPRADLGKPLLVKETVFTGGHDNVYLFKVLATFAEIPFRPRRLTPRPRIQGVQSAIVVGPKGEEIHTDELGRVRVKFHWDREHEYNDESSCWIRVSQVWAGLGYGMINLPRVGQEVLVDFFDGDPDRPIIVGRVFNNTTRVPYALPANKTKSGWKSDSSPGSNGFNELSFEDKKGAEEIHIQAERDFSEIIKNNQSSTVLSSRNAAIGSSDSVTVGSSLSFNVGDSESHVVKSAITCDAGELHAIHVASGTGTEIRDKSIKSSTGGAMIILDGDNIIIQAKGSITLMGNEIVDIHSVGKVVIEGGETFINCDSPGSADPSPLDAAKPPSGPGSGGASNDSTVQYSGKGTVENPGGFDEAAPNMFLSRPARSAELAPPNISIDLEAAKAIKDAVLSKDPRQIAGAIVGAINKPALTKALAVFDAVKDFKKTGGMSLLQIPELKKAVGSLVSTPIIGKFTGADIANVLNAGQKFGLYHLSKNLQGAADFVTAAAPEGAAAATAKLTKAVEAFESIKSDPASVLKDPSSVIQLLGVKTDKTPAVIDGAVLEQEIQSGIASGLGQVEAQAKALATQNVALYQGDFSGTFTKVLKPKLFG
jgi:type VI secretion system secreted protein VgrG